jgi:hypothetical protein
MPKTPQTMPIMASGASPCWMRVIRRGSGVGDLAVVVVVFMFILERGWGYKGLDASVCMCMLVRVDDFLYENHRCKSILFFYILSRGNLIWPVR